METIFISIPLADVKNMIAAAVQQGIKEAIQKDFKKGVNDFPELLTEEQAMKVLNLGRTALWNLKKKNAIPFTRINRRVYYKYSALMAWMDQGTPKS